jgi:hypothetical protein
VWTCCEGQGDAEPCRQGKHLEVNNDTGSLGISESEESNGEEEEEDVSETESEKQRARHDYC